MDEQRIWVHGYGCDCPNCGDEDTSSAFLMMDDAGVQLDSVDLPTLGEVAVFKDQHGNKYEMIKSNIVKVPT